MAKFIFVVPPFFGHINPTLSIGRTLLERGHKVIWAGIKAIQPELVPEGGLFIVMDETYRKHKDEVESIIQLQDKGANMPALEALKLGLENTYVPFAKIMIEEFNKIVDEHKPDVIVNDCITFVGGLTAHLKKIPCATITPITPNALHNPEAAPKITEWMKKLIDDLQRSVGITDEGEFILSNELNMYYTSQKFTGYKDEDCPPHMKFIGALSGRPDNTDFDWERLTKVTTPVIYVSLGTVLVDVRKDFFSKIIQALGNKPVTVIVATNPDIFDEWPDNFIVQGYVPQSALLKHVDVVIGHGGLNTVCDTYMNGIPMLIVPMAFDQSHTAALIDNYGCGIRIKYSRMRVKDIEYAIDELLYNSKYKKAAKEIQQSFIEAGGNKRAAELLEGLCK